MALRIRRGLSSDRTSITPEEGEFLYTTDTYEVYIGDGTTPGGNPLYTLSGLGGIGLTDLSATTPLSYDNATGVFSIQIASATQSGYLSNTNWLTFNNKQDALTLTTTGISGAATLIGNTLNIPIYGAGGSGSGSVTTVSVVSANGLAGTVANATTTPAITLSTTITGLLKGNGTAISAATAGTDYQAPLSGTGLVVSSGGTISYITNNSTNWDTAYTNRITSLTTTGSSGAATLSSNTLNIPNYTAAGLGAVSTSRLISTTTPLQGGGDLSADRTLSILQATTSQSGYLSSTDWTTFNNKQAALSGTGIVKSTSGTISYLTDNSSDWNTAFGWGNHASAGYLTSSLAATTYTPLTRTLTINGVGYDLSANRSWTISTGASNLDGLSDVVIASVAYGDILQYTTSNQWENVNLSALISVGANNGLSFSGGDVILGGELDIDTTIATYNTTTSTQRSLSFTAGSTAFSSPGAGPVKVTETTANAPGRSALYVGANDNHATLVEGKGAPVTTAPTYKYERSSANLLKNATIYSKAKQGLGLYTYVDSNETYTSVSRYATPSIPAVLIEKSTGLIDSTIANGINPISNSDIFEGNQLFNLLSLRLSRSGTTSNFVNYYGVEMSFESVIGGTSNIVQLSNLRAYSTGGEYSNFSITTRISDAVVDGSTVTINDEYTGLTLSGNGILYLPGYETGFTVFRDMLSPNINPTTGGIISIDSIYGDVLKPQVKYGDNIELTIIDEAGTATSSVVANIIVGYSLKRIRITNPGSGYVTAPSVTIAAPPYGGTLPPVGYGWTTGVTATGNATLTSTGEVDFIKLSNSGTRYTTIPSVTIAAPPSGVTATAVAEFGVGEVLAVVISSPGAGYTSGKTRAIITNQTYNGDLPIALLGIGQGGKVIKSSINLDYLLNPNQSAPFGTGSTLLHNTLIAATGYTFGITAASVEVTAASTISLITNDSGNRIYRNSYSVPASNSYNTEGISSVTDIQSSLANSILEQSVYNGSGTFETGSKFSYHGYNSTLARDIEIYAANSADASGTYFSGAQIALGLTYNADYSYVAYAPKSISQGLSGFTWGTSGDGSVFVNILSTLQTTNYTATYPTELGGKHSIVASGYYEDTLTGTYVSSIEANATEEGGIFRGIQLKTTSDFSPLLGTSSISIDSLGIYIKPETLGATGSVLTVGGSSGLVTYTTLSAVATSGDYADLTGTPTIPTNLDDLADVSAASPTNGQVLSYNTSASAWQAVTFSASGLTLRTNTVANGSQTILDLKQGTNITIADDGVGGVTISSSGGSGGVGLDSVFMLMGA